LAKTRGEASFKNTGQDARDDFRRKWRWVAAAVALMAWGLLLCTGMNYQYGSALRFLAWTKEAAAVALALLILEAPARFPRSHLWFMGLVALGSAGLLWGLHDPFYMDGILTAGRSQALWRGEPVNRFSLSYAMLGITFHWLGNSEWVGHLHIALCFFILLVLLARFFRSPLHRALLLLLAFWNPWLFVLSKWLYLDIPLAAGTVATVLAFAFALHRNRWPHYALASLLLLITCLLKESGILLAIPLIITALASPSRMRLKAILHMLAGCIAAFCAFWLLYRLFRDTHEWRGEKVAWLLFNPRMVPVKEGLIWFAQGIMGQVRSLALWAFLIVALAGCVRIRKQSGRSLLAAAMGCHLTALLAASAFQLSGHWNLDPLGASVSHAVVGGALLGAILILTGGLLAGKLAMRRPTRLEMICWITLAIFVLAFSATGKVRFRGGVAESVVLDWRYMAPAAPFALILAARGALRLLAPRNGPILRILAAAGLAFGILLCALRSTTMVSWTSEKARLNGRAYDVVRKQRERLIYTHWPFFMSPKQGMDYGKFRWHSDGFEIRPLWMLKNPQYQSSAGALALQSQDEYQGVEIWRIWPEPIFDRKAQIQYLRPFRLRPERITYHKVYAGRKAPLTSRRPPLPSP